MILYGLKTCDTCRRALSALRTAGREAQLHDIREQPLSTDERARFHAAFGDALLNRRSTTWRGLDESTRAGDPLTLLADYPTLMKRPVIDDGDTVHLGWGKDVQTALLG